MGALSGPHKIIDKISDVILKIKLANDHDEPAFNVHINYAFNLKGNPIDGLQWTIQKTQVIKYKITAIHLYID